MLMHKVPLELLTKYGAVLCTDYILLRFSVCEHCGRTPTCAHLTPVTKAPVPCARQAKSSYSCAQVYVRMSAGKEAEKRRPIELTLKRTVTHYIWMFMWRLFARQRQWVYNWREKAISRNVFGTIFHFNWRRLGFQRKTLAPPIKCNSCRFGFPPCLMLCRCTVFRLFAVIYCICSLFALLLTPHSLLSIHSAWICTYRIHIK